MTNTWEPDRDVLDVKKNRVGSTVVSSYDYAVNSIGQRSALSQTGTAFASVRSIAWGYDSYGQLTSADSTVTGQDRAYQYDAMGNRQKSADTLTLPGLDNYTANALNQYTSMSVGVSPTLNPLYDSDGNATAYPLPVAPTAYSTLAWDAENRMISSTAGGSTTFYQYDANSRRIAKSTGTTTALSIYDGWNVIAEYALQNSSFILHTSRLWGMDLSGTLQGAGGVGGLLCESQITNAQISNFFPAYDGNGNVSEYLSTTGTLAAHYEYDPFGNAVVNSDATGQFNYRFSTKPLDSESGLYYYGYRYYDPVTGRWPSRDPIEERGGKNLYGFVGNDAIGRNDSLGLMDWDNQLPGFGHTASAVVSSVIANTVVRTGLANTLFSYYQSKIGTEMTLTKSQVKELNIENLSIALATEFSNVRQSVGGHTVANWTYTAQSDARMLNELTVHFDGYLIITEAMHGCFAGKMYITDTYDFNPRPWGERDTDAELETMGVYYFADGKPFDVTSDHFDFSQSFPPVGSGTW